MTFFPTPPLLLWAWNSTSSLRRYSLHFLVSVSRTYSSAAPGEESAGGYIVKTFDSATDGVGAPTLKNGMKAIRSKNDLVRAH